MTMMEKYTKQRELIELQRAFIKGEVKENELTIEQKEALEKLFDEQIVNIKLQNKMLRRKMMARLKKDSTFVELFQNYCKGLIRKEELNDVQKAKLDFVFEFMMNQT